MKKITQKYRKIVELTALVFTVALLLAVSHNLLPVAVWTQHTISRTPVNLTAIPISTMNKPIYIARTGSIENSIAVPIHAEYSGRLSEMYVTEGQAVKAGQSLLTLQVSTAPTTSQNTGGSQQAQANYDNALQEVNRYQKLYEIGGIPRRQLDIATAQLQAAKANLTNTQNNMPSANATINGAITINAPIGGIVTGLSAAPGKTVQAGQQLLSLGSGQAVEIVVQLDQNDLYLIHLGTPGTIEVSQQTIAGQVSRIYPQIEANKNPAFLAHIKLSTNPAGLLKLGMSVAVRIDTGKSAIVPAVPKGSVFQDDQTRNFIYIAANGKAIRQQITIGETIGDFIELTSNLPQQSMVITSNMNEINDGDAITVLAP